MKFIHIADVHLGAVPDGDKPWSESRSKELWETFADIMEVCNRERADLLLIAGDLFHRQPLKKELKEVAYLFGKLNRTQVVMIAGNHDYIKENSPYQKYIWPEHVHFLSQEEMGKVYFPFLDTEVWGMSYHSQQITEALYDDLSPEINESYRILLAHGGDETHIPIRRDRLATAGFHYVALGHIHAPAVWERQKMAYSGSLEPLNRNETGARGYILGEITEEGTRIRFVPFAKREYILAQVSIDSSTTTSQLTDELRSMVEENGTNNLYRIVLEGRQDMQAPIELEQLETVGNIVEVTDKTRPDYNFTELLTEHQGDMIGKYIEALNRLPADDVTRKALDYGIFALLSTKEQEG